MRVFLGGVFEKCLKRVRGVHILRNEPKGGPQGARSAVIGVNGNMLHIALLHIELCNFQNKIDA